MSYVYKEDLAHYVRQSALRAGMTEEQAHEITQQSYRVMDEDVERTITEDVYKRYEQLLIEQEARKLLDPAPFEMRAVHSVEDLEKLPEASFLLDDYIVDGGRTMLAAEAGSYKSFLAIDWACQLAAKGKRAAYFALEGQYTLKARVGAWRAVHPGVDLSGLKFPDASINLTVEENVRGLVGWLGEQERFDLVVLDNLNRAGLDDEGGNSPTGGLVVRALDRIVEVAGSVVAIHNFGWSANRMRGPSKLRDGMDTMVYLRKNAEDVVTVTCDKQKSFREFEPRYFRLRDIPGTKSAVVEMTDAPENAVIEDPVWDALLEADGSLTNRELQDITGLGRSVIGRRLARWVNEGVVMRHGDGTRGDPYRWSAVITVPEF